MRSYLIFERSGDNFKLTNLPPIKAKSAADARAKHEETYGLNYGVPMVVALSDVFGGLNHG